jgi:dTDP-glucose 4,6-dehydratase
VNVLVTGGAGFIGSHLVDLILADRRDWRVTVLDALTYAGDRRNLDDASSHPAFSFVEGDIADPEATGPLVAGTDLVVNMAAESFVDRSIADAGAFVRSNVAGTQVLLDAARRSGIPMVQVSTDEVYGSVRDGFFTEDSPLRPGNPYAATKAGADLLCRSFHHTYGVDVRIVRGANAFGPRQHPEKAIPTFTLAALSGRPVPVYGDGSNRREWLFVEDFARAIMRVAEQGEAGEIYNAGGGHEVSNLDLARAICTLAGADVDLVTFVDDRPGHDFRYSMAWERIATLGWKPEASFQEALAATVDWFRSHPERWGDHE